MAKDFIVDVHRMIDSKVEVKVKASSAKKAKQKAQQAINRDQFQPLDDDRVKDRITSVTKPS